MDKLREAVFSWREQGYPNVTPTTKRLLQFWFAQREAIETLIYIEEVLCDKTHCSAVNHGIAMPSK